LATKGVAYLRLRAGCAMVSFRMSMRFTVLVDISRTRAAAWLADPE
jgi:hypothetical protein